MSHYSPEQWVDFVRGILPAEQSAPMRLHLRTCTGCARETSLLENAALLGRSDRAFEPPAELVAAAEAIFMPLPPAVVESLGTRLRRLTGKLEWDSFGGMLPEGVRSLRPDARHAVYRAGRYSIDIILDSDPESGSTVLTGQVADELAPGALPGVLKPLLLSGSTVISSTTSTEFGEFSLQYSSGQDLSLWIPMEDSGERIELPLLSSAVPSTEASE